MALPAFRAAVSPSDSPIPIVAKTVLAGEDFIAGSMVKIDAGTGSIEEVADDSAVAYGVALGDAADGLVSGECLVAVAIPGAQFSVAYTGTYAATLDEAFCSINVPGSGGAQTAVIDTAGNALLKVHALDTTDGATGRALVSVDPAKAEGPGGGANPA